MAVDMQGLQGNRPNVDTTAPTPASDAVVSDQLRHEIKQLLGKEVTAHEMLSYMSRQSSRLNELQVRTPVKAASGEMPPPPAELFEENDPTMEVTSIEEQNLEAFSEHLMQVASEGGDSGSDFINAADGILDKLREQFGDAGPTGSDDGTTGGIFDWMMVGEVSREAQEVDERWRDTINKLVSNKNVDAVTVLLALGEYMTDKYGHGLKEAFKLFHSRQEGHEKFVAGLDLQDGQPLDATQAFKAQQEQQAYMMDSQMGMQTIQTYRQQLDKAQNMVNSEVGAIHTGRQSIIRNVRAN